MTIQFLYLIASGNKDSIYKVGISDDPKRRLEQIKATYNVPRAFIVETMDVSTRIEVFALENALHTKFARQRSKKYGGQEFFKLTAKDIEWIESLFKEESNDFAQARAFYSLTRDAAEIQSEALKLEAERQNMIDFNRRNGKTYDTKPKGKLKRYNELMKKIEQGHLGSRFKVETYAHPTNQLCDEVEESAAKVIKRNLSSHWLISASASFIGSMVVCSSVISEDIGSYGLSAAFIGAIGGGFSQASRSSKERGKAKEMIAQAVDNRYPGLRKQQLTCVSDKKNGHEFLVSGFGENQCRLRNEQVRIPKVDLPSRNKICSQFENKFYFPKVAVAVAIGFSLMQASSDASRDKRSFVPQPQVQETAYYIGKPHKADM